MSHTSPETFLVWAIMGTIMLCFFLYHLWCFDKFRCLKWNSGPYSGAFKRVMTYSYLLTIPLLLTYSTGFTVIKYKEGLIDIPPFGIVPKPWQLWSEGHKKVLFPLQLVFAVGWSFEIVTHLEELCFWLFLVNAGAAQQDWFKSAYFKTWVVGGVVAVTYMPLVAIFTRSDPLRCEAFTFLAGSLGSLSLTLWFTPILWTFPTFLNSLRREGVDQSTICRLTKFHELNMIRVVFRFIMVVPLVVLGIDGVRPHVHINTSPFWTDFLVFLAGFGCSVSSGITMIIFFPRSIEQEIAAKEAARERKRLRALGLSTVTENRRSSAYSFSYAGSQAAEPLHQQQRLMAQKRFSQGSIDENVEVAPYPSSPFSVSKRWEEADEEPVASATLSKLPAIRPNRRMGDDVELGGIDNLTENNLSRHNSRSTRNLTNNHALANFRSPIDFAYLNVNDGAEVKDSRNGSRLTFNRRY